MIAQVQTNAKSVLVILHNIQREWCCGAYFQCVPNGLVQMWNAQSLELESTLIDVLLDHWTL